MRSTETHSRYRILVCPNAFKGSLTASEAARAICEGIGRAAQQAGREVGTHSLPLADGGDGTLETLVEATDGTLLRQIVRGPLGRPVEAAWGRLGGDREDTAVIEMAQASGLRLLSAEERDPLPASTYGTGELMRAAFDAGCRTLLVGIGGSATNDGGAGMAQALGARLLDAQGRDLPPGGAALRSLARIDLTGFRMPAEARVVVLSDVDNPLTGPEGASAIYGPQKGATPAMVRELDEALAHYAQILREQLGADVSAVAGAGAAGGLGAGLMAFCKATLRPGIEAVLEVTGFEVRLRACDLVVTGEGRLDAQTARGKVVAGVARAAKAIGVPVVALAGEIEQGADARLQAEGLSAALCILEGPRTLEEAMRDTYRLLADTASRMMRLIGSVALKSDISG